VAARADAPGRTAAAGRAVATDVTTPNIRDLKQSGAAEVRGGADVTGGARSEVGPARDARGETTRGVRA
jgi:hypothetical protein